VNFVLLGTVVSPNGRNIAIIQGNPTVPGGAAYHQGEEPIPGYRVTHIARDGATIEGGGQSIELKVQTTSQPGMPGVVEGEEQ
jgi:hypothetical protein